MEESARMTEGTPDIARVFLDVFVSWEKNAKDTRGMRSLGSVPGKFWRLEG